MEGPYRLSNGWTTVFITGPDGEVLEFGEFDGETEEKPARSQGPVEE
ncbi:hypothetical protein [Melghirimyces profundicolus]|nr:hypothetical protein [Melghirimyces profundicolus]